jgi:hypothetical protein
MTSITRKMQRAAARKQQKFSVVETRDGGAAGLDHANAALLAETAQRVGALLETMSPDEQRDFINNAFVESDVVIAVYPSPKGPDHVRFHAMKGAHLILQAGKNHGYTDRTTAIPLPNLEIAEKLERDWVRASGEVPQ